MTQETSRMQQEELLKTYENRYRALFFASRDAIMTLEPPSWKFTSGNPATLEMFGLKSEEDFLTYEPWRLSPELQLDGRKSEEKAGEMIEKAMRDGRNFFEWTHRRANGEDFPAEVLLSRVENEGAPFLHAVVRDITERKRVEEKLKDYEEEKFKAVFDHANDGMVLADAGTKKFSLGNIAFSKMLGYDLEEIKNLSIADIHPEKDLSRVLEQFEKQKRGNVAATEDLPVKRKDGSIFYADINASPLKIGEKEFVLGIFRDTTERRNAERLQLESNEKFFMAFQTAPYAITITRVEDGKFIDVNDLFTTIMGFTRDEAIASSAIGLNLWVDSEDRKRVILALKGGAQVKNQQIRFRKKNGEVIVGLFSAKIIHINGEPFIFSSIDDITEQQKAEERIKELNEIRNKFIEIISHQLRTPLTSVNWNLEMLLKGDFGKLEETQRKFLQATHTASVQITNRIHNLLTAIDVEEGRVRYVTEEVAFDSLCSGVVKEVLKGCELKNLTCVYPDLRSDIPPIYGDGEKLRTAVTALIENAVMYTKEGGSISVNLGVENGVVRFEVRDTGVGIPEHEQHHVFSRFFRASNASVMQPNAFGLGLYVAKNFIEQHHGKIGFESKEGAGSTFWFEIPVKSGE